MPWSYNDGEELERLKTGKGEQRTRARGTEKNEKWGTNRELEMNLLSGLGLKLGFVPTFHFPVPRARSLF